MKIAAAIASATLSLGLSSCSGDSAHAQGDYYSIGEYLADNHIQRTFVHHGDLGSPTINLAVPTGWQLLIGTTTGSLGPYASIAPSTVLSQHADLDNAPLITASLCKLTGDVDEAQIIEYAPGKVKNLDGYEGGDGTASTLGGFPAWQISGTWTPAVPPGRTPQKRIIAQKQVVFPSHGAVFLLELITVNALDSDRGMLIDLTRRFT